MGTTGQLPSPIPTCWQIRGVHGWPSTSKENGKIFTPSRALIRPGQWAAAQGKAWPGQKKGNASAMGRSRRVDSRVFNGGPWLTHVDGSPPLLYRPLVGLYVWSSNRGRGCTMQELRTLSFGPQKHATPGRLPERRPCPAGQDMSASQVTTAELDASCLLHAV